MAVSLKKRETKETVHCIRCRKAYKTRVERHAFYDGDRWLYTSRALYRKYCPACLEDTNLPPALWRGDLMESDDNGS